MGGTETKKDRPAGERLQPAEPSNRQVAVRVALFVALVVVVFGILLYALNRMFATQPGLQEIVVDTAELNCGGQFTFYYDLGAGDTPATEEHRALSVLYTQAAIDGYRIFNGDMEFDGCQNLCYLNAHVNEAVAVDPALYAALELLEESGTRYHCLAPMYELYTALFHSGSDQEAADYDPYRSEAVGVFFAQAAAYAGDATHVSLELLGENTVRLNVSSEYLRFAQENGVSRFIGLGWLENAFLADYMADTLTAAGYTRGALISGDGCLRSLDEEGGSEYALDFTYLAEGVVSQVATLRLSGGVSMVFLRAYPVDNGESGGYYVYEDGTIRTPFVDPSDGLDRTAIPELAACSDQLSCAEIALRIAPVYIAETFAPERLEALAAEGIAAYYWADGALVSTGGL